MTAPVTACGASTEPGVAAGAFAIAPVNGGARVVWPDASGGRRVELAAGGAAIGAPEMIAAGAFDRAVAATVGDRVVVAASRGDTTSVLGAALGVAPYLELALIGGVAGNAPVVTAGGTKLAPSVWYGGLLVSALDDSWIAHTAQLAVLTPASTEIAAATVGDTAVIVWSTADTCYVEVATSETTGTTWSMLGACHAPALAGDGTLVFERPDGVYLGDVHGAQLIAPGARAPRVASAGGRTWLAYLDASGNAVAGVPGEMLSLGPASSLELVEFGGAPRVVTAGDGGLTTTALCAE